VWTVHELGTTVSFCRVFAFLPHVSHASFKKSTSCPPVVFLCTTKSVTQNSSTVLYIVTYTTLLVQDIFFTKYQWHFFYDTYCAGVLQGQMNMLY